MKKISSLVFLLFFFKAFAVGAAFSDVPENHRYATDIQYLEDQGVVQEKNFSPNDYMTREVFAKWLLKNNGFNGENFKPRLPKRFLDVKFRKNPHAPYIYKLTELSAVPFGFKNKFFKPKEAIRKIEALKWLFVVEGISTPRVFDESSFQAGDVKPSSKIAPIIYKAQKIGILPPGNVYPNRKIKRGEAAHLLRMAKNDNAVLTVTLVSPTENSDLQKNQKFDILSAAWARIFQNYLRQNQLDGDKLVYGAIEGMVKEIGDKHSNFERPGENALLDSLSGEIEGIGAVIQMKDEDVVILTPLADSPAEKAGLLPHDIILKVDDVAVKGMTLTEVVKRIKGPKGTEVKIQIRRGKKLITFTITRDVVIIVSAKMERTDDNIAIIELNNFGEKTQDEFETIAAEIAKKKPKGIVLDMRNNPGGFLNTAIDLGGFFIKHGEKVARVKYPDHEDEYISKGSAELSEFKTMILVNNGTASAAEILAGALQDYSLATIIGEKTYGKGTVQEISEFSDRSSLKLTVAEWLTPKGRSIEANGIPPDIEVKFSDEDRTAGKDPQLDRALAELRK